MPDMGDQTTDQDTTTTAPSAAAATPTTPAPTDATAAPEPERMFTQKRVNDLLARQKRVFLSGEPDEMFTVPSELRQLAEKAKRLDDIEEQNRTEIEKATKRAEEAEQRISEIQAQARETGLRASIIAEAAKPARRVVDSEAVVEALTGSKKNLMSLDDDGSPTNLAEAMDQLLEQRPYLVASSGGTRASADQGARGSGVKQLSEADLKSMTAEQIVAARREGRLTGLGVGS